MKTTVVVVVALALVATTAGVRCTSMSGKPNPDTVDQSIVSDVTGSMSGWLDRKQLLSVWQTWEDQGHLTLQPVEGFRSVEDRHIPLIKMGTEGAPGTFLNALTHAREVGSIHALTDFMRWLILDGDDDLEAAAVLARTDLTIMPIVNPDGYQKNVDECPHGGGLHRKNVAEDPPGQSCGDNIGVDLNRNFDDHWDGEYSSDSCGSEIYRGPGAASEPETQAFVYVAETFLPKTAVSMHTYGNVLIYPYGWQAGPENPPGDFGAAHREYGDKMVAYPPGGHSGKNVLEPGTAYETLGIGGVGNGAQDDWLASDKRENPAVSFTIELGPFDYGFWPTPGYAGDLALTARYPLTYASLAAGCLIEFEDVTVASDDGVAFEIGFTPKNVGQSACAAGTFNLRVAFLIDGAERGAEVAVEVPDGLDARTALEPQELEVVLDDPLDVAHIQLSTTDADNEGSFVHTASLRWEADGSVVQGKCYHGVFTGDSKALTCECFDGWFGDRCQTTKG